MFARSSSPRSWRFCSPSAAPAWGRTWKDDSGLYAIEATFVKLVGETVHLRKDDGTELDVPLARLCTADQNLVKQLDTQEVVAEGLGTTPQEALDDACRRAVRRVAGCLLNSNEMIENDKVISKQLLTFSEGIVTRHEEIGPPRLVDGLYRQKIRATVRRRDLLDRLSAAAPSNASGVFDEAYTKLQRLRSGLLMLQKELEDYPVTLLRKGENSFRVKSLNADNGTAKIVCRLSLHIDKQRFAAKQARLLDVLESLGRISGTIRSSCVPSEANDPGWREPFAEKFVQAGSSFDSLKLSPRFPKIESLGKVTMEGLSKKELKKYHLEDASTRLVICVDPGEPEGDAEWRFFEIDGCPKFPGGTLRLTVAFRDEEARPLYQARLLLGPVLPGVSTCSREWSGHRLQTVFLSPFYLRHEQQGPKWVSVQFARSLVLHGETTINAEHARSATLSMQVAAASADDLPPPRPRFSSDQRPAVRSRPQPPAPSEELAPHRNTEWSPYGNRGYRPTF